MAGLCTYVRQNNAFMYGEALWQVPTTQVAPDDHVPNAVVIFTCGDPNWMGDNITATSNTSATDAKVFLRQTSNDVYWKSHGSTPGWLKLTWFRVRKAIPATSFSNFSLLLQDQAFDLQNWGIPATLGSGACRYLKWMKTKLIRVNPGGFGHFKMNRKYRSPKMVTKEVDGTLTYLATPLTFGVIAQYIPTPRTGYTGIGVAGNAPVSAAQIIPNPYSLAFFTVEKTTMYTMQDNDPNFTLVALNPLDGTAFYGNEVVPPHELVSNTIINAQ